MDDVYLKYPRHEDMPCLDVREESMSSSSDSDISQSVTEIKLSGKCVKRKWIKPYNIDDLDPGLNVLFKRIVKNMSLEKGQCTIYPPCVYEDMKNNHKEIINSIKKLNYEQCFVFAGRSLVSTLNITNHKICVPKGILYDVCIISKNNPLFLLTLVENVSDVTKHEKYNELMTRGVTNILRTFMSDTVNVIRGVVKGNDLKSKIRELKDEEAKSLFARVDGSYSPYDDNTVASTITAILMGIARAHTHRFLDRRPEVIWTLTAEEFQGVLMYVEEWDLQSYESKDEDTLLLLEIACRKSRRRNTRLDLTSKQYKRINKADLREWYPNLELTDNAVTEQGIISGNLMRVYRSCSHTAQNKISRVPHPGQWLKKRRNGKKQHGKSGSVQKENKCDEKTPADQSKDNGRIRSIMYCLMVLGFFCLFRKSIPNSWTYCAAKCSPILLLLYIVGRDYLHYGSTHKKAILLFGLVCSCFGDAFLVWKQDCFELGLTFFSLAHISYGFAFGLQPLGLRKLAVQIILTFSIFFYFTWKLQGVIFYILLLYAVALSVMGWRVFATMEHHCCYGLAGAVLFLISNISILVKMSEAPYPCSHYVSMSTYYAAQLGMVTSILKMSRAEIEVKDCKHRTKVFFLAVTSCAILSGIPSLHAFLSRHNIHFPQLPSPSEVIVITCFCSATFWCLITAKRRYYV